MDRDEFDALLEMHLHGELPASLRRKADAILATEEGRRRLEEIRESDRRILQELPPARMAEAIRRKGAAQARVRGTVRSASPVWKGWGLGAGLAAALSLVLLAIGIQRPSETLVSTTASVRPVPEADSASVSPAEVVDRLAQTVTGTSRKEDTASVRPAPDQQVAMTNSVVEGIRTKGGALSRLRIHLREADGGVRSLRDGDTVPKVAVLQVSLGAGEKAWVAVVSVDAAGQATLHLPEKGDSAILVDEETAAPHAFQLDDAPGFERFLLIASPRRFSLDQALSTARRAGRAEPAHAGWRVESLRVVKP